MNWIIVMQLFYNCVQFSAKPGLFGESHYHRLVHFGRWETIVEERRRFLLCTYIHTYWYAYRFWKRYNAKCNNNAKYSKLQLLHFTLLLYFASVAAVSVFNTHWGRNNAEHLHQSPFHKHNVKRNVGYSY